jgi:nucleotide-binding universal stress UspA family protein
VACTLQFVSAMKLLLATDFSEAATSAGAIAFALARRGGDTVVLLHVAESPTRTPLELAADARTFEHALRERARADLRATADAANAQAVQVIERLETGEPAPVIASTARDLAARMIVLGTHGRRAIGRFLLGSVAHDTFLLADRPLLVARRGADATAFNAWAAGRRRLRVTVGIDRSAGTVAALAWLRWLRALGPADVRLVNVCDPVLEAFRLGPRPGLRGDETPEAIVERDLRAFVGEFPGGGAVTLHLHQSVGRPGEVVAQDAENTGADLLVLGTNPRRPRLWLGSTAELALRCSRLPVLLVPAPQA